MRNSKVRDSRRIFLFVLLALFCAPLVTHIYLGSYSRFLSDDFCSAAIARSHGIIRGTHYWYLNWRGRFSANFLDTLFGYLGPAATPYATGIAVTAWFIVLTTAVVRIIRSDEKREAPLLQSCVIATIILFAVLHVIPFIGQSLYWGEGMRTVVPPLILGTAYTALIANRSKSPTERPRVLWVITAGLLTFVAAGFAETYFAVQTAAILFALIIPAAFRRYTPPNKRNYFVLSIAGLVGSFAGGFVVWAAPGNNLRQGTFTPPAIPELLSISFRGIGEFFELTVLSPGKWCVWVGLILSGFIFGLRVFRRREDSSVVPPRDVWTLIWLPVVGFVLLLACWVPMAWATASTLNYRTMIIPAYVLVSLVICWAYIAGQVCCGGYALFAHRTPASVLPLVGLLAFGVFAVKVSRDMWQLRPAFIAYAQLWDERDQTIQRSRSQGLPYAVVARLHNWAALEELTVDPEILWLSKCVQDYYGIGVIPHLGDLYGEPDGAAKQAALEQQFDAIPKLPGSVPTQLNQIYKTGRGKIGFYNVEVSSDQIQSYYVRELTQLGWQHVGEKKLELFHRFTGGTQDLFCSGRVAATLFTTGEDEARLGYTYSLTLNWGMSSGFTLGEVDCR
jgi:uncharacterized protein DUF6056